MGITEWWVAAGALLLLLVLGGGAWLITVIVRRSNDRATEDTQPLDLTQPAGTPQDDPRPESPPEG